MSMKAETGIAQEFKGILNLFYEEPDPDRWIPFDRIPRRLVRRIVRGPYQPGGMMRIFLNLRAGLDQLSIPYRVNDYRHLRRAPNELACVVGKPHVLCKIPRETPILFGAAGFIHPLAAPGLFERRNLRRVLVPCLWMRDMFAQHWPNVASIWPVGIDTDQWAPQLDTQKDIDVLVYDKIRWRRDEFVPTLLSPTLEFLKRLGLRVEVLRYGFYKEKDLLTLVRRSRAVIFICEHETQGIALQQILASDVPVLAWDRGGAWQDPTYFPHTIRFSPVTSVPYWDERCGQTFEGAADFEKQFDVFWAGVNRGAYRPRDFIVENLTLAGCAANYVRITQEIEAELATGTT